LKAYVKDEDLRRIVTLYQSALSKLKIMLKKNKVDFIPLEKWQEEVIKNKDFEIAFGIFSFSPDTDIPYTLFSQDALLTGYNFVGYRNELVDKLLWENRITFDPDVIRENKKKIQQIIRDDSPYTFLFILPAYTGIRKNVLKGVDIHPFHFFAFIKHWYLEEGF
jgi:peptide/nickel transport system substrate-binding protein